MSNITTVGFIDDIRERLSLRADASPWDIVASLPGDMVESDESVEGVLIDLLRSELAKAKMNKVRMELGTDRWDDYNDALENAAKVARAIGGVLETSFLDEQVRCLRVGSLIEALRVLRLAGGPHPHG